MCCAWQGAKGVARSDLLRATVGSDRVGRQLLFARLARCLARLDALLGDGRAMQEAVALIAGLDDVAVMGKAIQQRRRLLRVAEHARPLGVGVVGGNLPTGA